MALIMSGRREIINLLQGSSSSKFWSRPSGDKGRITYHLVVRCRLFNRSTVNGSARLFVQFLDGPKPTEMAKKMCPRLRDSAFGCGGDFTQPRTHFFGHLCRSYTK